MSPILFPLLERASLDLGLLFVAVIVGGAATLLVRCAQAPRR